MNKLYWMFMLAMTGTACQQQAPSTQQLITAIAAKTSVAVESAPAKPELPVLFTAADTLTQPMRQLLRQYDLSALWQGDVDERREHPTLDGFFGADHYRFSLVFTQVRRDAQQPEVYHVQGKCRYRKNIRSFTGLLTVRQIADLDATWDYEDFMPNQTDSLPSDTVETRYTKARSQSHPYSLRVQLQFQEETNPNSGLFEGEGILNMYINSNKHVGYVVAPSYTADLPGRGSAIFMRGKRFNVTTKQLKNFVVASDVFAAAPDIYKDFGVGDRGGQINPRYARLGWNEAWENDEWWADEPTARL
jgi:hypothetical protein